jgi:hypothetical protein
VAITCLLARLSSACLSFIHTRSKTQVKLCRFVFLGAVHLASSTLLCPLYPCARLQRKSFPACLCFFDSQAACKHFFTLFKSSHRTFGFCLFLSLPFSISNLPLPPITAPSPVFLSCGEIATLAQKDSSRVFSIEALFLNG